MRETKKPTQEIFSAILSGDSQKIWEASCAISSLSQNHTKIMELVPYKQQIIDGTKGIELGGLIYKNSVHFNRAIAILDFHEQNLFCPCHLLCGFDNPHHLLQDGYFTLVSTWESNYMGERNCISPI